MAKKRRLFNVLFPLGGLNRKNAVRQQPPFTTPDCRNVRPTGTLAGRERGGSRPGMELSHIDDLGSNPRFLEPMTLNLGDSFKVFSDIFGGTTLATNWTQASWSSNLPSILSSLYASIDTSVSDAAAVLDVLPIDTSKAYTVEMLIIPWKGEHHGTYRLYLRMDDTTPAYATEGVMVELTMTGSDGAYSGYLKTYTGSTETSHDLTSGTLNADRPGWLSVSVSGDNVTVRWAGQTLISGQAVDTHTGKRTGFGLECTVDGGVCLAKVFRVQYYSTGTVDASRTMLIGSAGGNLYREATYGRMEQVTSDLTVRSDVPLTVAQSGQKLYIADYGDLRDTGTDGTVTGSNLDDGGGQDWSTLGIDTDSDVCVISNVSGPTAGTYTISSVSSTHITLGSAPGDGTCSYRIERGPKIYDPEVNTISLYTAASGKGQVPTGCPLICRYNDRIVLAGAEIAPHVWYMARRADETDWDYAPSPLDNDRPVAGTASEPGVPGTAITTLVPHSDDYLIIACKDSLWRLRGDPCYGGTLDALSRTIGIIGRHAWCLGPASELIFLSLDGLYILPPGGESRPISISREVLPDEFKNLDPNTITALLEYDVHGRGVHIYLTEDSSNLRLHWWLDWDSKTFWPVLLSADHEPTASCNLRSETVEDSSVILGGRDGYLRRFTEYAETDCGTAFTSYVVYGPIGLAVDGWEGRLMTLDAVMAENGGDVTWATYPAQTFEATLTASASDTATWSAGLNATVWVDCKGQAFTLKLTESSGRRWAVENITALVRDFGRRRLT